VGLGVADHPLAAGPGALLAGGLALGRVAGLGELVHQRVADLLELFDAGDVWLGPAYGPGRIVALQLADVGGELGLEPADLAAKLLANLELVAFGVGIREVVDRDGDGSAPLPRTFGDSLLEPAGEGCADHRHDAEIARARARGSGIFDRADGDLLELGSGRRAIGDEGAEAVLGDDEPLLLEAPVDGAHRVDVDLGPLGEAAEARQPITGREPAARDQRPQPPAQLQADRQLIGGVGRERARKLFLPSLCHQATQ
jgi:hypothetical protein